MRIGFDGRKLADYGIGTYVRGLLRGLSELDHDDEYVVFAPPALASRLPDDPRFRLVSESSPHYSLRELAHLGYVADRQRLHGLPLPHYGLPITSTPVVVALH